MCSCRLWFFGYLCFIMSRDNCALAVHFMRLRSKLSKHSKKTDHHTRTGIWKKEPSTFRYKTRSWSTVYHRDTYNKNVMRPSTRHNGAPLSFISATVGQQKLKDAKKQQALIYLLISLLNYKLTVPTFILLSSFGYCGFSETAICSKCAAQVIHPSIFEHFFDKHAR